MALAMAADIQADIILPLIRADRIGVGVKISMATISAEWQPDSCLLTYYLIKMGE
jgi:hypothetical protein